MPTFESRNPYTGELLETYSAAHLRHIENVLSKAQDAYHINRTATLSVRLKRLQYLTEVLEKNKNSYAALITAEMGKPITQSEAEIEKCAALCRYYTDKGEALLSKEETQLPDGGSAVLQPVPLGVVLCIMPWNFPFWQVFRCAVGATLVGNAVLLKHAPNVPQCALAIEAAFKEAFFAEGIFQNVFADHEKTAVIISDARVQGVAFTGSVAGGAKVAQTAGKHIKKTVLELGGSDAFVVLADAPLKEAAKIAVRSRMINSGQSCIAAKRFIVAESIADTFEELVWAEMKKLKMGDPMDKATEIGPLARRDLVLTAQKQVEASLELGATLRSSGVVEKNSLLYPPTLLTDVVEKMPVFCEEVFAPVFCSSRARDEQHALELTNTSEYGLGASVWTSDMERGKLFAKKIQTGTVGINRMVQSYPEIPFGGVKKSGYGKELGAAGLWEFTNLKSLIYS